MTASGVRCRHAFEAVSVHANGEVVCSKKPSSYRRYRIRGRFDVALSNLARFHRQAAGTQIRVIWQYVVFRWNDKAVPQTIPKGGG